MNPEDTFPQSNLPADSQAWRRRVEDAIYELINRGQGNSNSTQGLNRNTAANMENLGNQVRQLGTQIQRVNDLYNALPVAYQATSTETNFGLSSAGWNTIARITFNPPARGTLKVSATMSGQLISDSTSTNMEVEARLLLRSSGSPPVPGLAATPDGIWQNNFVTQWGWSVETDPDRPVVIQAQIDPVDASSWNSGTGSSVVLSGFATFVTS